MDVGGRCLEMGCERSLEGVGVNIRFVVLLVRTSRHSWERHFSIFIAYRWESGWSRKMRR